MIHNNNVLILSHELRWFGFYHHWVSSLRSLNYSASVVLTNFSPLMILRQQISTMTSLLRISIPNCPNVCNDFSSRKVSDRSLEQFDARMILSYCFAMVSKCMFRLIMVSNRWFWTRLTWPNSSNPTSLYAKVMAALLCSAGRVTAFFLDKILCFRAIHVTFYARNNRYPPRLLSIISNGARARGITVVNYFYVDSNFMKVRRGPASPTVLTVKNLLDRSWNFSRT